MDGRTGSVANRRLSKGERRDGKVKSQGKGEKVALYSAAAICQTPSAEEGITGRLVDSERLTVAYHLFKEREERRLSL